MRDVVGVLDIMWVGGDIVISACSVIIVPLLMWSIWHEVTAPLIRPLTFLGVAWVIFCIMSGLAHLNWTYRPTEFPTSLVVLHTATAVGIAGFTVTLAMLRSRIVDALNSRSESTRVLTDANIARIRELGAVLDSQTAEGNG